MSGNENAVPPLRIENHSWGAIVRGRRYQISAAGLIPIDKWPTFAKGQRTFHGRLAIAGKQREVTIEQHTLPTDDRDGEIWIAFDETERDCRPRVEEALQKLTALHAEIVRVVEFVKLTPMSEILAIPGAKVSEAPPEPSMSRD